MENQGTISFAAGNRWYMDMGMVEEEWVGVIAEGRQPQCHVLCGLVLDSRVHAVTASEPRR